MDKKQILLIEDEQAFSNILVDMLDKYDIKVAANSDDAINLLQNNHFDLALIDIMLKGSKMQGDELVASISKDYPAIKMIMISQLAKISIAEQCFDNGAKWYIHKTCPRDEIIKKIDSVLTDRKHLYEYYCSLDHTAPGKVMSFTGEGHLAGKAVCELIGDRVPVFPDEVLYYLFFTPFEHYDKKNINTIDWSVPDLRQTSLYPADGIKNKVLLFSEGENIYDVYNALEHSNIPAKQISEGPQLEGALFDGGIASVVLFLPPAKSLFYLRKIKLIDPRIEVMIYHKQQCEFQDAIMLKAGGAYRLVDNLLNLKDTIINMNANAENNFKNKLAYGMYMISKTYWCQGFSGAIAHHILKMGRVIEYKELDLLRHIYQVLCCEGYGD